MRGRLPPVLRERDYARLIGSSIAYGFGREMVFVAVGWQVYDISRNPLHLGLVGLAEFLPLLLLALPAGAIADRFSRKLIYIGSLLADAAITAGLLVVSLSGAGSLWPFLALSFASGCSAALGNPAVRSMWPALVPLPLLTSALALRSTVFQATVITGPAVGGLIFAIEPDAVYGAAMVLMLGAAFLAARMRPREVELAPVEAVGTRLGTLLAGLRFVRRTPVLLGAISLDLVPSSSAGRSPCCRCSPATCSVSGRSGSECSAARLRWEHSPRGSCSRGGRSGGAPDESSWPSWPSSARA